MRRLFTVDEFSGGHRLHLAVARCIHNDLIREAANRGISLTHVWVSSDGGFAGHPCASTGIEYRIQLEGDASVADLKEESRQFAFPPRWPAMPPALDR